MDADDHYSIHAVAVAQALCQNSKNMKTFSENCASALQQNHKILICGNGGSAAQAQHFAAELVGRYSLKNSAPKACIALADGVNISAIGNDFGYERTLARQVEAIGNPYDVLIGLTTSGTSENVIEALRAGRKKSLYCYALTGSGGLNPHVNDVRLLKVMSDQTPVIQVVHMVMLHALAAYLEQQ